MSKHHRTQRDRIEGEYLALAKEFSDISESYSTRLMSLQLQLERIESPRLIGQEKFTRVDAIDILSAKDQAREFRDDAEQAEYSMPVDEYKKDDDDSFKVMHPAYDGVENNSPITDPARAESVEVRTMRMCVQMLVMISTHPCPTLVSQSCLIALGAESESMRHIARVNGVSAERVSDLCREIRAMFSLPKNQHNKSDEADEKFRQIRLEKLRLMRIGKNRSKKDLQLLQMAPGKESFTIQAQQR